MMNPFFKIRSQLRIFLLITLNFERNIDDAAARKVLKFVKIRTFLNVIFSVVNDYSPFPSVQRQNSGRK